MDCDFQAHPWFDGIEWDKLYHMKAAFIPEVNDELDTQNFEKFEEVQDFPHFCRYSGTLFWLLLLPVSLYSNAFLFDDSDG